jgi:hypothetical protein
MGTWESGSGNKRHRRERSDLTGHTDRLEHSGELRVLAKD